MKRIEHELYQNTILRRTFLGLDTIQGILELAKKYNNGHFVRLCEEESSISAPYSLYAQLTDLQKNGYVTVEWEPYPTPHGTEFELKKAALTVQGQVFLDELRQKSRPAKIRATIKELLWIVLTSIITTIITVKLMK